MKQGRSNLFILFFQDRIIKKKKRKKENHINHLLTITWHNKHFYLQDFNPLGIKVKKNFQKTCHWNSNKSTCRIISLGQKCYNYYWVSANRFHFYCATQYLQKNWLVGFYGTSIHYLMPNPVYTHKLNMICKQTIWRLYFKQAWAHLFANLKFRK